MWLDNKADWAEVRKALIEVGYQGWITAEVPKRDLGDVVKRMDKLLQMGA